MIEPKKISSAVKIADVANPGASAPSPNSKSVIISHHPVMADPMVVPTSDAQSEESTSPAPARASRIVLKPLSSSELETPEPAATSTEPEDTEDAHTNHAVDETPEPSVPPAVVPVPIEDIKPGPVDVVEEPQPSSMGTDATIGTKEIQSEAEIAIAGDAEAKRQAELAELIENKTYYLPIVTTESQRTKQFIAVGAVASIVLAVLWIDVALDAGLVHLGGIHALTHFFN